MSTLTKHALAELELLRKRFPGTIAGGMAQPILRFIQAYSKTSQSGGSHTSNCPQLLDTLEKLMNLQPLTPLEDKPDQWFDPMPNTNIVQHKRYSKLFKRDKGIMFIEGIMWSEGDNYFWGSIGEITSAVRVPELPWELKTFRVEVRRVPTDDPDDNQYEIADQDAFVAALRHYSLQDEIPPPEPVVDAGVANSPPVGEILPMAEPIIYGTPQQLEQFFHRAETLPTDPEPSAVKFNEVLPIELPK